MVPKSTLTAPEPVRDGNKRDVWVPVRALGRASGRNHSRNQRWHL